MPGGSREMFLRISVAVFLILAPGAVFDSVCVAAPPMVEKNLFAADRKPPSPQSANSTAKPAAPSMGAENFQLDGVIIQDHTKIALLRMKNVPAGAPVRKGQPVSPFIAVKEGQTVSDYRVSKIGLKSIVLERNGQTYVIALFAKNKVVVPPSPMPPPVAAPAAPAAAHPPRANRPGSDQH